MKNLYALYCRVYAGLLSWLECHQPGVGGMKLPNRAVVGAFGIDPATGKVAWSMSKCGRLGTTDAEQP